MERYKAQTCIIMVAIAVLALTSGIVIGYFIKAHEGSDENVPALPLDDPHDHGHGNDRGGGTSRLRQTGRGRAGLEKDEEGGLLQQCDLDPEEDPAITK
jgi:hypothetical protein